MAEYRGQVTRRTERIGMRLSEVEHERFRQAAAEAGLPFTDWARRAMEDSAAAQLSKEGHSGRPLRGPILSGA